MAAKLAAAGIKSAALTKAYAKNTTKPDAGKLAAALSKVRGAFTNAFAKAETHTDCQTTGDVTLVEGNVDAFARGMIAALRASSGIVFKEFRASTGLPVPVVLSGSFQFSATGPIGQVIATYGSAGTATLVGGPGTFTITVGASTVGLLPADPTSVSVNGASVSIDSALGAFLTDVQAGADPSQWSLVGQALLAVAALASTDAWVQAASASGTTGTGALATLLDAKAAQTTGGSTIACEITTLSVLAILADAWVPLVGVVLADVEINHLLAHIPDVLDIYGLHALTARLQSSVQTLLVAVPRPARWNLQLIRQMLHAVDVILRPLCESGCCEHQYYPNPNCANETRFSCYLSYLFSVTPQFFPDDVCAGSGECVTPTTTTTSTTLPPLATFVINYFYNTAGCPDGAPNAFNPYQCPTANPPGPVSLDNMPAGQYEVVVTDVGAHGAPAVVIWNGDPAAALASNSGYTYLFVNSPQTVGSRSAFVHAGGTIAFFSHDWYPADNDPSESTTLALYNR